MVGVLVFLCSAVFLSFAVLCWGGHGGVASVETHLWIFVQFVQLYTPFSDSVLLPDGRLRRPCCSGYFSFGFILPLLRKKDLGIGFLV